MADKRINNSDITDPVFREVVKAIDAGNIAALQSLLESHPHLIGQRLDVPKRGCFTPPICFGLWPITQCGIKPYRTVVVPPDSKPCNMQEMLIKDPGGYILRIGHSIEGEPEGE